MFLITLPWGLLKKGKAVWSSLPSRKPISNTLQTCLPPAGPDTRMPNLESVHSPLPLLSSPQHDFDIESSPQRHLHRCLLSHLPCSGPGRILISDSGSYSISTQLISIHPIAAAKDTFLENTSFAITFARFPSAWRIKSKFLDMAPKCLGFLTLMYLCNLSSLTLPSTTRNTLVW